MIQSVVILTSKPALIFWSALSNFALRTALLSQVARNGSKVFKVCIIQNFSQSDSGSSP
jgi:hypothetical protein